MVVAEVAELQERNAQLQLVNDGWIPVVGALVAHNDVLQQALGLASTPTD